MIEESKPTNLLDLSFSEMKAFLLGLGEKGFRAQQIFKWIHKHGFSDFSNMSDLSKTLREKLESLCEIKAPRMDAEHQSKDGTIKWILALEEDNTRESKGKSNTLEEGSGVTKGKTNREAKGESNKIETVFIPEANRGTLCISSQVGCALNCSFCSTAKQGFNRNLTVAEIIGQIWLARRRLQEKELFLREKGLSSTITNVVMMGMGEPLLNFEAVVKALSIMRSDDAYALPRRRVTLSTAGVVPKIDLLKEAADVSLAISLHAPTNELRDQLVPINKKYAIEELMAACKRYVGFDNKKTITMEYVMLRGVNDSLYHAKKLVQILAGVSCKINLIPFNPHPKAEYQRSKYADILQFQNVLMKAGFVTTLRKTRGEDIDAACGQLVGKVIDRTRRQQQWKTFTVELREDNAWMEEKSA